MRVVKSFKHAHYVVELFKYGEKYTLKIKDRGIEQSYPIPQEHLAKLEGELNNPGSELYDKIAGLFKEMHFFWGRTLLKLSQTEESGFSGQRDEII